MVFLRPSYCIFVVRSNVLPNRYDYLGAHGRCVVASCYQAADMTSAFMYKLPLLKSCQLGVWARNITSQ